MEWLYKWLNKLSLREKRILYLTVFLISLFLLDRFVVENVLQKVAVINTDIAKRIEQLEADKIYLDEKNRHLIEEEYKKYTPYISPTQLTSQSISKLVEDVAKDTSITIDKIEPIATGDSSKKTSLLITCVGDRKNLISFLYQLSTSSSFLKLKKLAVSSKKEDFVAIITLSQSSLQTE